MNLLPLSSDQPRGSLVVYRDLVVTDHATWGLGTWTLPHRPSQALHGVCWTAANVKGATFADGAAR
jgi:hypothetical protein